MTVTSRSDVYYDMYDVEINVDPYPVYRRLREEAPLYFNEAHDFYAVSRFEDVERGLLDPETFISGRGAILEVIRANIPMPPGVLIFEDPPVHSVHRRLVSRAFTARRVAELEAKIREFCGRSSTRSSERRGSTSWPIWADSCRCRQSACCSGSPRGTRSPSATRPTPASAARQASPSVTGESDIVTGEFFGEYIDWRADHPSDDFMTELLQVEFEDETGTVRRLTRDEILTFVNVIASAGNETTNRLIGWTGKVLADHPDQRRELVEDRSLIPNAIEEILRFEPPATHVARYVANDVEVQAQTVPEGSVMVFLPVRPTGTTGGSPTATCSTSTATSSDH